MEKQNNKITFLTDKLEFPPVDQASAEGLLAVGGDLSADRLLLAYSRGIFPWFNEDSLILWWSPDPRMILFPNKVRISRSMRKVIQRGYFSLSRNRCFERVIEECAQIRRADQKGTWITEAMKKAYIELHHKGFAVSYEVWRDGDLVGGLYGVDLGHVFCGESMFSKEDNASKYALIMAARELEKENYSLIDCQLHTKHLESLGAEEISRKRYIEILTSHAR
ncbi:MAG: leucyl/phenylalanyl-tRNA--protein transferase [Flavobacteriaceae bacterium]